MTKNSKASANQLREIKISGEVCVTNKFWCAWCNLMTDHATPEHPQTMDKETVRRIRQYHSVEQSLNEK